MATVRHLGLLPNVCFPFREREQLKWRQTFLEAEPIDLGVAPDNAYLKLTKAQATFIYWRVKEWEVSWGWDAKAISNSIAINFGESTETVTFDFSYAQGSFSQVFRANHLTAFDLSSGLFQENNLPCRIWDGGIPRGGFQAVGGNFEISSFYTSDFDPGFTFGGTRTIGDPTNSMTNAVGLGGLFSFLDQEQGLEVDEGWVPDDRGLLYWPYTVDVSIMISDITTDDGILFAEDSFFGPNGLENDGQIVEGTLPPIRGTLTTHPRGSALAAPPSPYSVDLLLNDTIIEMPLFDATDPSPRTETRFNVDGFTGVTIKPHSYWPYDPNDGLGPIYDSETGEQLRAFPA
jgi:hypothetical protein